MGESGEGEAPRRRRWVRVLGVLIAGIVLFLAVGTGWWVLTYPEAEPAALATALADPNVEVIDGDGLLEVHPASGRGDTAVVFYPGAAVPAEAYLPQWAPIVDATGVSVYIPSLPLRLAVLSPSRATQVIDANPAVDAWWVGGHSLGGAMSVSFASGSQPGELQGVILWGAYASEGGQISDRDDLVVLSVAGSVDGLSTPQDIAERRSLLPDGAMMVELDGVSHAQFGSYGLQAGDGTPTVSDERARELIADVVVPVLAPAG